MNTGLRLDLGGIECCVTATLAVGESFRNKTTSKRPVIR